ncbi:hypothetical protein [Psychrobacter sp. TB20-MNA-CIBAN-0197]|uniref:hypothetical protein n=1 Tax=Psychrobacter sp. TB20-MNA-CIBAN-0197 TaxID=3140453 RepID=UPI003333CD00
MAVIVTGGYALNAVIEHRPYIALACMFAVIASGLIMAASYSNRLTVYSVE